jgi:hypothetical protein
VSEFCSCSCSEIRPKYLFYTFLSSITFLRFNGLNDLNSKSLHFEHFSTDASCFIKTTGDDPNPTEWIVALHPNQMIPTARQINASSDELGNISATAWMILQASMTLFLIQSWYGTDQASIVIKLGSSKQPSPPPASAA